MRNLGLTGALGAGIWAKHAIDQAARRTTNSDLITRSLTAQNLNAANQKLDALLIALRLGQQVKQLGNQVDADVRMQVTATLQQALYGIREYNQLPGEGTGRRDVKFNADGKTVTLTSTRDITRWSVTGKKVVTLPNTDDNLLAASISSAGRIAIANGADNLVTLLSPEGQPIQVLRGHRAPVWHLSFSPDGQTLATASQDKTVKLWTAQGKLIRTLNPFKHPVSLIRLSPDGKNSCDGGRL